MKKNKLPIVYSDDYNIRFFGFYEGRWIIRNRKLKNRLCNSDEWIEFEAKQEMKIILLGLGNTDNFVTAFDEEPFEGRTIDFLIRKLNYGVCIGLIAAVQFYNRLRLDRSMVQLENFTVKTFLKGKI